MSGVGVEALRVGIAGKRGQAFIAGLRSVPGVCVAAFCDLDSAVLDEVAARYDVTRRFRDYDDMLASDLDAVIVATPMQLHVRQSVAGLRLGLHVLSEVTAAVTLDDCRLLVETVRASGRSYMIAENYCYTRANALVGEMARRGLFGDLYYAEGAYVHDCHHVQYDANGGPTWRVTWQVGKRGCTYGTHSLGPVLQWLDDRIATVACMGSGVHTVPAHTMDDTVTMLCQTARGSLVSIRLDMQSHRPHTMHHYALQGTQGAYQSARRRGEPDLVWIEGRSPGKEEWEDLARYEDELLPEPWRSLGDEVRPTGHGGSDFFVARDFALSILEGRTPSLDVYRALDFTLPGLVSEESIARGGMPLRVPDPREW